MEEKTSASKEKEPGWPGWVNTESSTSEPINTPNPYSFSFLVLTQPDKATVLKPQTYNIQNNACIMDMRMNQELKPCPPTRPSMCAERLPLQLLCSNLT